MFDSENNWLLYGVLFVCQSVQPFWKEKAPVCREVRSSVQYKCLAAAGRGGAPAELTAAAEKFFLQRLIDKEYVSFRELLL